MTSRTQTLIDQMVALGPLRVWSVIITIFGDFARGPGDSLSAERLRELTGRMGIRPESLRVALHRLRKDGWITTRRCGRSSVYELTAWALSECNAARARIYALAPAAGCDPVFIVSAPPDPGGAASGPDTRLTATAVQIAPRVVLDCVSQRSGDSPDLVLSAGSADLPDWVRHKVGPPDLVSGYAAFCALLGRVVDHLNTQDPSPDERDVFRILTIHRWRQLLLRHPDLPAEYFPDGWEGENCRGLVQSILAMTPDLVAVSGESASAVT